MSFDYGSSDRDRDRDHSDRRGHNNEREGGYSGGRTAVHDSYERDRENAREAGYAEREGSGEESRGGQGGSYGGSYGNDERPGAYNKVDHACGGYGDNERRNDDDNSSSHNRRSEREDGSTRGGDGSGSSHNNNLLGGYQSEGYSGDKTRLGNYSHSERQGYGDSDRRHQGQGEGTDNSVASDTRRNEGVAYYKNSSRGSHGGSAGLSGANSGLGATDRQAVGTQAAVAGIQHFAKSYDKSSSINKEEQHKYDEADDGGGSQAKESAFAKKLGERKGETEKPEHGTGDLRDKLVEGGNPPLVPVAL